MATRRRQSTEEFLSSLHPVVRRAYLSSGGAAFDGPDHARQASAQMYRGIRISGPPTAPPAEGVDYNGNFSSDVNRTTPGSKGMFVPVNQNGGGTPMNSPTRSRFKQPIDVGMMQDGSRAQIVGPNMVRILSRDGIGSSTFSVRDPHTYLTSHPGFVPSQQYLAQRQAGIESAMGMTKEAAPVVHPGAGGNYLSQGGVETPVENLGSADRMKNNAYNPGVIGDVTRAADTLTASPAANVVGRFAGKAVDSVANGVLGVPFKALANAGRSLYNGFVGGAPAAVDYGQNVSDGSAGASRRQAARIETPTMANPVPVTETSPEPPPPLENPPPNEDERFVYGQ